MKQIIWMIGWIIILMILIIIGGISSGCITSNKDNNKYIVMTSGTTLGLDVSSSSVNQIPQGTLAYKRIEMSLIPINTTNNYVPNTLMEFQFKSKFLKSSSIYSKVCTGYRTGYRTDYRTGNNIRNNTNNTNNTNIILKEK